MRDSPSAQAAEHPSENPASAPTPETVLEVRDLSKRFGGVQALSGVACRVPRGIVFAVIGPNGAGKTTFFNCLTGIDRPTSGDIIFDGKTVTGWPAHRIASHGMARTWQTIRLFDHMTVLENVLVGRHSRGRADFAASILRLPRQRREERAMRAAALEQLEALGLADLADESIANLPFLQQRRVELARALAAEPSLLLLDEPAAGLNARETAEFGELILSIRDGGVTVVLVEHDMSLVMDISDHVFVLDHGVPIAEGPPRAIQENERVIAVYLGTDDADEAPGKPTAGVDTAEG